MVHTVETLLQVFQQVEDLQNIPVAELEWMASKGEVKQFEAGDLLIEHGEPVEHFFIVLTGSIRIYTPSQSLVQELDIMEARTLGGLLPYSRMKVAGANGEARERSSVFLLHKDHFPEMIHSQYNLTEALVYALSSRIRTYTMLMQHQEKLRALGKLSAGLAHELNNPSTAILRCARELKKHLGLMPDAFKRVISIRISDEQVDAVNKILFDRLAQSSSDKKLSLADRAALEDEIVDWLLQYDLEDPDGIAEILAEFNFNLHELDSILSQIDVKYIPAIVNWLFRVLTTESMVKEIQEATHKVNHVISAMKDYTYMDQAQDRQEVDINGGIHQTLVIMEHRIRNQDIKVNLDLEEGMPPIIGYPGELNQVWTNIIENALDAMADGGLLEINSSCMGNYIQVSIVDSGPGIDYDILPKIFDPFFSTKKVGQGIGLGLDLVKRILDHHRADIKVSTQPGKTEMRLAFPIKP